MILHRVIEFYTENYGGFLNLCQNYNSVCIVVQKENSYLKQNNSDFSICKKC